MFVKKKDPVFGKNLLKLAHTKKRWWGYLLNEDPRFESDEDSEYSSGSGIDFEAWDPPPDSGTPSWSMSGSPITEHVDSDLPDRVPKVISEPEDGHYMSVDDEEEWSPDESIDSSVKRHPLALSKEEYDERIKKKNPKLKTVTKKKRKN